MLNQIAEEPIYTFDVLFMHYLGIPTLTQALLIVMYSPSACDLARHFFLIILKVTNKKS